MLVSDFHYSHAFFWVGVIWPIHPNTFWGSIIWIPIHISWDSVFRASKHILNQVFWRFWMSRDNDPCCKRVVSKQQVWPLSRAWSRKKGRLFQLKRRMNVELRRRVCTAHLKKSWQDSQFGASYTQVFWSQILGIYGVYIYICFIYIYIIYFFSQTCWPMIIAGHRYFLYNFQCWTLEFIVLLGSVFSPKLTLNCQVHPRSKWRTPAVWALVFNSSSVAFLRAARCAWVKVAEICFF